MTLLSEKVAQATQLVADSDLDIWLTFVRETAEGGDPILPFLIEGGLVWQSALLINREGRRIALVGNYDAEPLRSSGNWHEVVPYVQSLAEPLVAALDRHIAASNSQPRIGVNFSADDVKADGLSHGMYLLLEEYLRDTRFEGSLVSAEQVVTALRARKTPEEVRRMRTAIAETDRLIAEIAGFARIGKSERAVQEFVQSQMEARGLGYAWDRTGDPIVNSGPDSPIGHGIPSPAIAIAPGHIVHIDLGVIRDGYSSDMQRCWYVPQPGQNGVPAEVARAFEAVYGAISAGADQLKPGVAGWEVDAAARDFLTAGGYPEYLHAFGHQVGRLAHDGGAILGPRWPRYGRTPLIPIHEAEVYTLELGVSVPDHGYLGLEEMAVVTSDGCSWLTDRQK